MTSIGRSAAIRVESLCLNLDTGEPVVEDVSFDVAPGEILGVVGESGSGKTTVALALLGYMRPGVNLRRGSIQIAGQEIVGRDARSLRSLRGKVISYVPQDPGGALNPSMRVGDAILDVQHAFSGSPQQFRAIARRHGATLLLVCPNMAESTVYRARNPGGFYDRLAHGKVPDWLEPVPLPKGSPLRLWRIR